MYLPLFLFLGKGKERSDLLNGQETNTKYKS